jgi:uncharacterized OsmC-like protein
MTNMEKTKAALLRAQQVVSIRPERGIREYINIASVIEGTMCTVHEGGHTFQFDVPQSIGGADMGPSPSVILRAALSSCVAIGIKQSAALHDVDIAAISVTVNTIVDARGQLGVSELASPGFEKIDMNIDIISDHTETVINAIVADSMKRSPLLDVFERPQVVNSLMSVKTKGQTNGS